MVILSKYLPPTNPKSYFLLDVTTISSIHLLSLNIINLIPIPAFLHYLLFLQIVSQISSTFPLTHCPSVSSSMVQLYAGGLPELVNIASRCRIQRCHTGNLKSTIVELFTPYGNWKLANTTDQGCFCFWELVVKHLLAHVCPRDWLQTPLTTVIVLKSLSLVSDKLKLEFWLLCLKCLYLCDMSKLLHLSKSALLSEITHVMPLPQERTK